MSGQALLRIVESCIKRTSLPDAELEQSALSGHGLRAIEAYERTYLETGDADLAEAAYYSELRK